MKFYNMAVSYGADGGRVEPIESAKGKWTTRDDAEQAAKDAVATARLVLKATGNGALDRAEAQAIIERYEGGSSSHTKNATSSNCDHGRYWYDELIGDEEFNGR